MGSPTTLLLRKKISRGKGEENWERGCTCQQAVRGGAIKGAMGDLEGWGGGQGTGVRLHDWCSPLSVHSAAASRCRRLTARSGEKGEGPCILCLISVKREVRRVMGPIGAVLGHDKSPHVSTSRAHLRAEDRAVTV
jgi:hypothetical protein